MADRECPDCEGTGKMLAPCIWDEFNDMWVRPSWTLKCATCKGTGRVPVESDNDG